MPSLRIAGTVAVLLAGLAPSAQAESSGLGGFVGAAPGGVGGRFAEPSDVAVYLGDRGDPADDKLFVVEALPGNNRVQRLDRHGNFELAWGRDVVRPGARGDTGTGYEVCRRSVSGAAGCKRARRGAERGELSNPTAIAVSQSPGRVYVMDHGNRRVQELDLDGRFVRAWRHGFAGTGNGSIAVSPAPPHHVFVGDPGKRRVLELEPDGRFVRAWRPGRGVRRWPSHVAVDRRGVLYASEGVDNADVLRFDTRSPSRGRVAPLRSGEQLSSGWTMGLEVDPASGALVVARNPFGPMVVDVVHRPGAPLAVRGKPAEALSTVDDLPYVESVNGIGVAADGSVYVAKSRSLSSYDPGSGFERCRSPRGLRACQGLMVLASGGPRTAALEGVVRVGETTASLEGKVQPRGAARYRFQVSDGGRWRDVGKPRYVSGPREVRVSTLARGLRPGALYRARLLLATRDRDGEEDRVASNIAFLVTVRPEAFATARPARAFAPLVQLHSDERSFPISASRFLQRATVKWKDGHCIGLINVATGRIASRKTPGAARVRPSRLGRAARPYRHRAFDRKCERRRPPVYSAIDLTRPFHRGRRAAGLPRDSGFYLDLLSDSYDGDPRFARRGEQRLLVGASAYYERRRAVVEGRPGIRLAYWLLYGSSRLPRVRGEPIGQHEGDWERIDVLARPGSRRHRWLPRAVRFHVGDRHRTLPWRDVLRQRSHPVVFAALGSHRPYPHAGRYELSARVAGRRARLLDETAACARCPQWETWKRLGPVRRQPWYGFGGGWGLAFRHHDTSGPLGPR